MPPLTPALVLFFTLAGITILTALGMLLSRSAVYSALFLVLNFSSVAFLYFVLGAPFIALAQITVYAGAIMVLFLFVIMLLGAERVTKGPLLSIQNILAVLVGLVVLAEAVFMIFIKDPGNAIVPDVVENTATAQAIGTLLYDQYLLPFEVTSFILLVAVIGAILLTRVERIRSALGLAKVEEK